MYNIEKNVIFFYYYKLIKFNVFVSKSTPIQLYDSVTFNNYYLEQI